MSVCRICTSLCKSRLVSRSVQLSTYLQEQTRTNNSMPFICTKYLIVKNIIFLSPSWMMLQWFDEFINKITSSLSYIHNTSSILQLLWYLYIKNKTKQKNYNTMYFNLFSLFFSTTYFVLYLVWYVYDNTYNLIVDYSQFIITFFFLAVSRTDFQNMRLILRWIKTCPTQ